jgi:IPTL-CTERM motif
MKRSLRLRARSWSGIASAVAVLCLAAPAAIGAPITFVFSGPATGTLGMTPFTAAQVSVTGTADTSNVTGRAGNPAVPCINLTSVTVNIAGVGSASTTSPNYVFDNPASTVWGFTNGTCASPIGDYLDVTNPLAATYGLVTSLGPSTGVQAFAGSVNTTSGILTFTSVPLTFQATLSANAPVPTLSQWALLLLVLALATVAAIFLRRRTMARQ